VSNERHMADTSATTSESALPFSREVGVRLRAVRRQRRLSLDDVERASGGRWSASAIGAYERGFRNLSLPRLRELAEFYDVPMSMLLGEIDIRDSKEDRGDAPGKIVLDLVALEQNDDAASVLRYARSIVLDRGDWNGRMLSVRRDDVRALASVLHTGESDLIAQLEAWGALLPSTGPLSADAVISV
jgi:transcriptional regulator with XRE-family HTH domain